MIMRIRILRQTSIQGQPARVGDVIEVSPADGRLLLGMGKAEPAPDPAPIQVQQDCPLPTRPRKPRTSRTHGDS